MPHSIIHGDACFAYFNKIRGIPQKVLLTANTLILVLVIFKHMGSANLI
jgi:hypothetical protein